MYFIYAVRFALIQFFSFKADMNNASLYLKKKIRQEMHEASKFLKMKHLLDM
jgi:hypothetical protein